MENSNLDINCTPPEIKEVAERTRLNLLPKLSKNKYENEYITYKKWKDDNHVKQTSENVILAYFDKLSTLKAPSTLWSIYSMLKSTIDATENIDIKNYTKVTALLRNLKKGFQSKKSQVFTANEIQRFLTTASDEEYLEMKVSIDEYIIHKTIHMITNIQTW